MPTVKDRLAMSQALLVVRERTIQQLKDEKYKILRSQDAKEAEILASIAKAMRTMAYAGMQIVRARRGLR